MCMQLFHKDSLVKVKYKDRNSVLFRGQTSIPYNRRGKHLDLIKLKITASDAAVPKVVNSRVFGSTVYFT